MTITRLTPEESEALKERKARFTQGETMKTQEPNFDQEQWMLDTLTTRHEFHGVTRISNDPKNLAAGLRLVFDGREVEANLSVHGDVMAGG